MTVTEVWPSGKVVVRDVVNTPEVTKVVETSILVSLPLSFPTSPLWMRAWGSVKVRELDHGISVDRHLRKNHRTYGS